MKLKLSEWLLYLLGWANWVIAFVLEWLDKLQVDRLQKIFLLLSINLLVIATIKYLFGWRFGPAERTQSAAKTVALADDPNGKARLVMTTIEKSKGGLIKMFVKLFETFKKMSKKQWASFVFFLVGITLGIASQIYPDVPGLEFIDDNIIEFLGALGLTALPGILSAGKELGEAYVNRKNAKAKIKQLSIDRNKKLSEIAAWDLKYKDVIDTKRVIDETGRGSFTEDQKRLYETYLGKKELLQSDLDIINTELEVQNKIIEESLQKIVDVIKEGQTDE